MGPAPTTTTSMKAPPSKTFSAITAIIWPSVPPSPWWATCWEPPAAWKPLPASKRYRKDSCHLPSTIGCRIRNALWTTSPTREDLPTPPSPCQTRWASADTTPPLHLKNGKETCEHGTKQQSDPGDHPPSLSLSSGGPDHGTGTGGKSHWLEERVRERILLSGSLSPGTCDARRFDH